MFSKVFNNYVKDWTMLWTAKLAASSRLATLLRYIANMMWRSYVVS